MSPVVTTIPANELNTFCQRHGIRRLRLFGSVLRDDFRPESDIDVLVEFVADATPGLRFFEIEAELSALLDRRVELYTPNCFQGELRERVLREAEVWYDAP